MCGICGIFSFNDTVNSEKLLQMTKLMRYRGPDDEGYLLLNTIDDTYEFFHSGDTIPEVKASTKRIDDFYNNKYNLGFGFRRLSILDLTKNGHQPMFYKERGLYIVYNGEIYNYIEIREELKSLDYKFYSNSDTEVILKSYDKWGEECVHKFNGMWAFAIWDKKSKKLFCSRDRFGVKPFYYYFSPDKIFVFSSEIKPLLLFVQPEENLPIILSNFAFGISNYNEQTFFKNIFQLRGGHNLILQNNNLEIKKYYNLALQKYNGNFEDAKEKLRELLFDAVKIRLRSDVEVGFALSGGLDSTSIVCVANELNTSNNHTFSMVLPSSVYDESKYIECVIEKTKFIKHTTFPTIKEFINELDNFVNCLEEPFDGLSYYGEYKVRQITHYSNIKVCLDGQGGDEIFAGYVHFLPFFLKDLIYHGKIIKLIKEFKRFSIQNNVDLIQLFKFLFSSNKFNIEFFKKKYPYINFEMIYDLLNPEIETVWDLDSYLNRELYSNLFYKSIPKFLSSTDKISMAFSLECRNPFLDFRIVEFGLSLPYTYKIHNGFLKFILRESVKDIIPKQIYNRKDKIGFVLPESEFSNKVLKDVIKERIASLTNSNKLIFIDSFFEYFDENSNKELWKFWKTVSYLLWYEKFILNSSIKNLE